jgi:hypothetical protein
VKYVAGMSVATSGGAGAPADVAAFGSQQADRATQSTEVAAMTVDKDQTLGPAGARPAVFHQQHGQGFGPDGNRSGEILVLTAGAIGDGGRHQPWLLRGVQTRGNAPGDCSRDPGVGVQWQVRTMLFSGTEWNDY